MRDDIEGAHSLTFEGPGFQGASDFPKSHPRMLTMLLISQHQAKDHEQLKALASTRILSLSNRGSDRASTIP